MGFFHVKMTTSSRTGLRWYRVTSGDYESDFPGRSEEAWRTRVNTGAGGDSVCDEPILLVSDRSGLSLFIGEEEKVERKLCCIYEEIGGRDE